MLHYLWMFIVGIIVGAIARFIMPGSEHLGLLMTGVLGVVGSFVGGLIARLFSKPADGALIHPAGIVMSIIGSLICCTRGITSRLDVASTRNDPNPLIGRTPSGRLRLPEAAQVEP